MKNKKLVLKPKDIVELVEKYNPFGLKDDNKEIMLFSDRRKLYNYVIKNIQTECPTGYFDIPLWMSKHMGMPFHVCLDFVKRWRTRGEGTMLIDWDNVVDAKAAMVTLINLLHHVSETPVDHTSLMCALNETITEENDRKRSKMQGEGDAEVSA